MGHCTCAMCGGWPKPPGMHGIRIPEGCGQRSYVILTKMRDKKCGAGLIKNSYVKYIYDYKKKEEG